VDHQAIAFAIRWVHVVAMAAAFGGAILVTWLTWRAPADRLLDLAIRYEQLFWAAAGVLVMTGVGNLGAFGSGLPEPATEWGSTFTAKLWFIAALAALSLPRSLAVLGLAAAATSTPGLSLRTLYSATTAALAVIVALAIGLAHR
jgi:hypothetical protein